MTILQRVHNKGGARAGAGRKPKRVDLERAAELAVQAAAEELRAYGQRLESTAAKLEPGERRDELERVARMLESRAGELERRERVPESVTRFLSDPRE